MTKAKLDKVPITIEVSWDGYEDLGKAAPSRDLRARSTTVRTEGVADTGCTVLCGGPDTMRKLKIPKAMLVSNNLRTADGKSLTVLGAIPVSHGLRQQGQQDDPVPTHDI